MQQSTDEPHIRLENQRPRMTFYQFESDVLCRPCFERTQPIAVMSTSSTGITTANGKLTKRMSASSVRVGDIVRARAAE